MLTDFNIPRLSNDMKLTLQKNHLGCQILYRSFDSYKKRRKSGKKSRNSPKYAEKFRKISRKSKKQKRKYPEKKCSIIYGVSF